MSPIWLHQPSTSNPFYTEVVKKRNNCRNGHINIHLPSAYLYLKNMNKEISRKLHVKVLGASTAE